MRKSKFKIILDSFFLLVLSKILYFYLKIDQNVKKYRKRLINVPINRAICSAGTETSNSVILRKNW